MVALTQSVVLLHGVGCLGDQLLPWACSAPATSVTSDGGPGPCEELMEVSKTTLSIGSLKGREWGCWRLHACQTCAQTLMATPG